MTPKDSRPNRGRPAKDSPLVKAATKLIVDDERQGEPRPTTAQLADRLLNSASLHGVEESTACRAAQMALILSTRPSDITPADRKFLAARRRGDLAFLQSLEADRPEIATAVEAAKHTQFLLSPIIKAIEKIIGRRLTLAEVGEVGTLSALSKSAPGCKPPRS